MNDEMNLFPEKIGALLNKNFFIRSYQRGYRWTDQQVSALLNDIDSFTPTTLSDDNSTWYCLQPLVVKEMDEIDKKSFRLPVNEVWYEVIDGQQRLTTIYLLIHYANEMWIGKQKDREPQIKYETRDDSADFLSRLQVGDDNKVIVDKSNIDYFHMSDAYRVIHEWVCKKNKHPNGFNNNGFQSKLKEYTKVIWYNVNREENSIDVFTRLNMGKIPLTNAELVKALLLSRDSIHTENPEELKLKQLEIASEWDNIECQLNDYDFWGFITNHKKDDFPTKIEYILTLAASEYKDKSDYRVFNYFFEEWSKCRGNIKDIWEKEVIAYFETVKEWYTDSKLYHMVGYLISQGSTRMLIKLLEKARVCPKDKFMDFLTENICETLKGVKIEDIKYGENDKDIHTVLTLFNVLSVMNIGDRFHRYPFSAHKEFGNWSLEHIHAQHSKGLKSKQDWRDWLTAHNEVLKESGKAEWKTVSEEITKALTLPDNDFTEDMYDILSQKAIEVMTDSSDDKEVHGIDNLALLNKDDNSALNNSTFARKRRKIIELDKKGSYIPLCTRNVFLKYYDKQARDFTLWGPKDREAYMEEIFIVLTPYLDKQIYNQQA